MATSWREKNHVRWVGTRPGHDGDAVNVSGNANNATTILYTVPAAKILLLFTAWMDSSSSGVGTGYMSEYNAVPAVVLNIFSHRFLAASRAFAALPYYIPIEIPAGYSLRIFSNGAAVSIYAGFTGILIPA